DYDQVPLLLVEALHYLGAELGIAAQDDVPLEPPDGQDAELVPYPDAGEELGEDAYHQAHDHDAEDAREYERGAHQVVGGAPGGDGHGQGAGYVDAAREIGRA